MGLFSGILKNKKEDKNSEEYKKKQFILEHAGKDFIYVGENFTYDELVKFYEIDNAFFENYDKYKFDLQDNNYRRLVLELGMPCSDIEAKYGRSIAIDSANYPNKIDFYIKLHKANIDNEEEMIRLFEGIDLNGVQDYDKMYIIYEKITYEDFEKLFIKEVPTFSGTVKRCILDKEKLEEIAKNDADHLYDVSTSYSLFDKKYLELCGDKWIQIYEDYNNFSLNHLRTLKKLIAEKKYDEVDILVHSNVEIYERFLILNNDYKLNKCKITRFMNLEAGTKNFFKEYNDGSLGEIDILDILVKDIESTKIFEKETEFKEKYEELYIDLKKLLEFKENSNKFKEIWNAIKNKYIDKEKSFGELIYQMEQDYKKLMQTEFIDSVTSEDLEYEFKMDETTGKKYKLKYYNGEDFTMLVNVVSKSQTPTDGLSYMLDVRSGGRRRKGADIAENIINNPYSYEYYNNNGSEVLSMSVIDQDFMKIYRYEDTEDIILGYENIETDRILLTNYQDSGAQDNNISLDIYDSRNLPLVPKTATVTSAEHLLDVSKKEQAGCWNEISVRSRGLKPSYVLCFDEPREKEIRFATTYDIPIRVINTKCYEHSHMRHM